MGFVCLFVVVAAAGFFFFFQEQLVTVEIAAWFILVRSFEKLVALSASIISKKWTYVIILN